MLKYCAQKGYSKYTTFPCCLIWKAICCSCTEARIRAILMLPSFTSNFTLDTRFATFNWTPILHMESWKRVTRDSLDGKLATGTRATRRTRLRRREVDGEAPSNEKDLPVEVEKFPIGDDRSSNLNSATSTKISAPFNGNSCW